MEFNKDNFIQNYLNLEILKKEFLELSEKNWNPEIDSMELEINFYESIIKILKKKYNINEFIRFDYDSNMIILMKSENPFNSFIIEIKIY
jgi:hypothetical protein